MTWNSDCFKGYEGCNCKSFRPTDRFGNPYPPDYPELEIKLGEWATEQRRRREIQAISDFSGISLEELDDLGGFE